MVFFLLGALGYAQDGDASGAIIAAGIGIIIFVICYIISKFDYVTISNRTITGHKGVIRSTTLKSPTSKIQDVAISNGLFGKLLGYHTITVSTAGSNGAEYVFKYMNNAKQFQTMFIDNVNEVR